MRFDHELVEMPQFNRAEYFYAVIKGIVFLGFFAIIHQVYRWTPEEFQPIAALISEVNESLYQHFKMGFVIWIMLLILELIIFRNRIIDKNTFIFSRLTTTFLLGWITFTIWLILPGLTQNFEPAVEVEILWSFLATFVTGVIGAVFDSIFLRIKFNRVTKLIIITILITSYLQFVVFSFNIPPDWLFFDGPIHAH